MVNAIRRRVTNPVGSKYASPKAVVQQHMARECDINVIVERAKRGIMPGTVREPGLFADVSGLPQDLTEAFSRVEQANELFAQLPAKAREDLRNDPRMLLKADADFFVKHGLAIPRDKGPGVRQDPPAGAGEGSPAKPSKKASKAPNSASADQDGQD